MIEAHSQAVKYLRFGIPTSSNTDTLGWWSAENVQFLTVLYRLNILQIDQHIHANCMQLQVLFMLHLGTFADLLPHCLYSPRSYENSLHL